MVPEINDTAICHRGLSGLRRLSPNPGLMHPTTGYVYPGSTVQRVLPPPPPELKAGEVAILHVSDRVVYAVSTEALEAAIAPLPADECHYCGQKLSECWSLEGCDIMAKEEKS